MIDASAEIVAAIRAALVADVSLYAVVGERVSGDWGHDQLAPMIRLQVPSGRAWDNDEPDVIGHGHIYTAHVYIYTREAGAGSQRSALVDRVRRAVNDVTVSLPTSHVWWVEHRGTTHRVDLDDPGLLTARVEFEIAATHRSA